MFGKMVYGLQEWNALAEAGTLASATDSIDVGLMFVNVGSTGDYRGAG